MACLARATAVAAALVVWLCGVPASAQSIDVDRLDERLERLVERSDMVGLGVAVVEDGEITLLNGYGTAYIGGPPVTENTVFRWASLSKGVAGTVAGTLAAEDRLPLNAPIAQFNTSLRLPLGGERQATLTDVLAHRLGLVPNAYDTRLEDGRNPEDIREALGGLDYVCRLGSCHTYQNVAFDAVAEAVSAQTGLSYEEVADLRVFSPLGMDTASVTRDGLVTSDYARPHARVRRTDVRRVGVDEAYYRVPAAGGVNASIRDLATFMRAQMGLELETVSNEALTIAHTPRIETTRERNSMRRRFGRITRADYALGWRVYEYAGNTVIGHRGAVAGYRALILFDPERDAGVAALWNSESNRPVGLQFEVMDMLYGLTREDWMRLDGS